MKHTKHTFIFYTFISVIALLLYILDSTGILTFKIGNTHPILLIPLLVAVSMAAREWVGLVFGGLLGILLDITSADSYCFNLILLSFIGCACGLFCSYVINNNIYSALILSLSSAFIYFTLKWLVFYVFDGNRDVFIFFVNYTLISAIYTALFIIPFYYLIRFISSKTNYIT